MTGAETLRSGLHSELRSSIARLLPDVLDLTRDLAALDSGSYDADDVGLVVDRMASELRSLGAEIVRHPVPERADLLEGRLWFGPGPRVVLVGHSDTVWPHGTAMGWPWSSTHDEIRGCGVGDMKCALAMVVAAARAVLKADWPDGPGEVRVVLVPDEQLGSPGSKEHLLHLTAGTDLCLGLESGAPGGGVVVSRGAVGAVVIRAHGVTAHCTEPGGASTLRALGPLVLALEELSDPPRTLCSVGVLRGGSARQVVPDDGAMHVDLRAVEEPLLVELLGRLRDTVEQTARDNPGVRITVEGGLTRPAFPETRSRAVHAHAAALAAAWGLPLRKIRQRGGSDASFFAAAGIATLDGLGPLAERTCSRGEVVDRASIGSRTWLLASLMADAPQIVAAARSARADLPYPEEDR